MKTMLTIIMLVMAVPAWAEQIDLNKIAMIESSNNPKAYNKHSKATGLYQITPICLQDYNNIKKANLSINDMFEPKKAYSVASWYIQERIPAMLKHFKKTVTVENVLTAYNCGVGCVGKPLPKETRDYIRKYKGE